MYDKHRVFSRRQLLTLYAAAPGPSADVCSRIRSLGLSTVCRLKAAGVRRYRGRRAGRKSRSPPSTRRLDNGAHVIVGSRPSSASTTRVRRPPSVIRVHVNRHLASTGATLTFGCFNIQSLTNKLDDLLEVCRTQKVDVVFLAETWHDSDSVVIRRLRVDGYQVVDRTRPWTNADTMATNHGGVAAVAVPGIRLTALDLGVKPTTFELLTVRVVSASASCVVVVVYRTGPVTSTFFVELADVMDRIATTADPLYVVGDVNIHLERTDDLHTRQLTELLASYGLVCRVPLSLPTHDRGGVLDAVFSREDLPSFAVDVLDVDLSDHRLLRWTAPLTRPPPVYMTVTRRPWGRLDADALRAGLLSSALCRPDAWRIYSMLTDWRSSTIPRSRRC